MINQVYTRTQAYINVNETFSAISALAPTDTSSADYL